MESQYRKVGRRLAPGVAIASLIASGVYVVGCAKNIPESSQIVLEAANAAGTSPWMESISSETAPAVAFSGTVLTADTDSAQAVSGDKVGLYGGSPDSPVCDRAKMHQFLGQHPDKAAAFQTVTGAGDIGEYLGGLSPVVLNADTRVTNHGFDGDVTTFQAVLQKGTTVLIDDLGMPRVRCACGNPLGEPEAPAASFTTASFQGRKWTDWDVKKIAAVTAAPAPVERIILTNAAAARPSSPNAPSSPPLAIEVGETTPIVATPEVLREIPLQILEDLRELTPTAIAPTVSDGDSSIEDSDSEEEVSGEESSDEDGSDDLDSEEAPADEVDGEESDSEEVAPAEKSSPDTDSEESDSEEEEPANEADGEESDSEEAPADEVDGEESDPEEVDSEAPVVADEEAPAEESSPEVDSEAPVVVEEVPAEEAPAEVDSEGPAEEEAPAEESSPEVDSEAPVVVEEVPAEAPAEEEVPAEESSPEVDSEAPVVVEEVPAEESSPEVDSEAPVVVEEVPAEAPSADIDIEAPVTTTLFPPS